MAINLGVSSLNFGLQTGSPVFGLSLFSSAPPCHYLVSGNLGFLLRYFQFVIHYQATIGMTRNLLC